MYWSLVKWLPLACCERQLNLVGHTLHVRIFCATKVTCQVQPWHCTYKIHHCISSGWDLILIVRAFGVQEPTKVLYDVHAEPLAFSHRRNTCDDCWKLAAEAKAAHWNNAARPFWNASTQPVKALYNSDHFSWKRLISCAMMDIKIWWCPRWAKNFDKLHGFVASQWLASLSPWTAN